MNHWLKSRNKWSVPRAEHADNTKGLVPSNCLTWSEQKLDLFGVVFHPLLKVSSVELDGSLQVCYLGEEVDEQIASKVDVHGLADLIIHLSETLGYCAQLLHAPLVGLRLLREEVLLQLL